MANEKHQIDVELEEAVAQGTYANLAIISHSTSEFVLDFAAVLPGVPKAKVKSRIILAPEHAKRLLLPAGEHRPLRGQRRPHQHPAERFKRGHQGIQHG